MSFLKIFFLILCLHILSNCESNDELNSIINEYESNISQAKLITCINLLQSFLSQRDGDQKLKQRIKESKLAHDKLYIKYITFSIKKCTEKINSDQISYLLTAENSDNYNTLNTSITNLIKLEDIENIDLTKEEQDIYDKISTKFLDNDKPKKKNNKKNFYEKHKIIIITCFIILGSFLFYLRFLKSAPSAQIKNKNEINKKNNKRKGKK